MFLRRSKALSRIQSMNMSAIGTSSMSHVLVGFISQQYILQPTTKAKRHPPLKRKSASAIGTLSLNLILQMQWLVIR
eukprot:gene8878-9790_t